MRRRDRGFTLIELLITMALLATGAISIHQAVASYLELSDLAHDRNIAYFDLETALEDIRSTPFEQIVDRFPNGDRIAKFNGLHLRGEGIAVSYQNPSKDPLIITATISWEDSKGRAQTASMYTARTR